MFVAPRTLSRVLFSATLGCGLAPGLAFAQVMQPSGESMPVPTPKGEIDVVTSRGFPADAVTLEGLFKYRSEPLDPVADAKIEPGVFSPLCGFTGTLLLRGGSCKVAFGWYNVTPGSTTPPPDDEIYVLVPADTSVAFACADVDFCPLATTETTQAPQHGWTPMTFNADNIRKDARYKGGLVGFALKGTMGSQCPQTKFSQAELNPKSPATPPTNGKPWVTTLIYESVATPDAFYVAFEDLPVTQQSWQGMQGGLRNDGDFNDFVYFITGLTCEGGGELCDASATNPALAGVCAVGRTGCATTGGEPVCNPVVKPSTEQCDNLDNDCNGMVDDGDLCPDGKVCDKGTCVGSCTGGEIRCEPPLVCNTGGFCVDPSCKDVVCRDGQVCREGACVGGCTADVKCPIGQECQLGRCIDPCKSVECGDNQICEQGVCVSNCSCRPCGEGTLCAEQGPDAGRCVDPGCASKSCATGTRCVAGECVDLCAGVVCPGGTTCTNGECPDPMPPASTGGRSGGPIVVPPIDTGGLTGVPSGGAGGAGTNPPNGGGPGSGAVRKNPDSGCGCRLPAAPASGWLGVAGVGFVCLVAAARRRRSVTLGSPR